MNSKLSEFLSIVARKIDDYIFSNIKGEPEELYQASLHIIRSGGKRVRPAILMASGLIFTDKEEDLIPFAASIELIHTFTLIHDDIMDKDEYRRGVKTVHTIWGEPIAITAGDLLFAKAFELISRDEIRKKIDASRLVWAVHELSRATAIVAEGQALDMSFEKRKWVTLNEYLRMIYMKTGALLEASARIGGIIAGTSKENVDLLGEYAKKIGIAFQIRDDYLGLYGKEELIGKAVFNDIRRGKKTFFVSLAYQKGDDELKEWVKDKNRRRMFINPDGKQVKMVQEILKKYSFLAKANKPEEFNADPWLIVLAIIKNEEGSRRLFGNNYIIVTEESPRKTNRIPWVCKKIGIECTNLIGLIQREGWIF